MALTSGMVVFLRNHIFRLFPLCIIFTLLTNCSDPVEPEFDFKEGLIYIDALASTEIGTSYAIISVTKNVFGDHKAIEVSGASVYFKNQEFGSTVQLEELDGAYFPPPDFRIEENELWNLEVKLPDGREYASQIEKVPQLVIEASFDTNFKSELVYSEGYERFVPGHEITTTFDDPANEENYYFWRYKSFEKLINCEICVDFQVYREGRCIVVNQMADDSPLKKYYTYECEEDCWKIRYSQNVNILSDEFINGKKVTQLPIGEVLLYTNDNILLQLQQFSISPNAYRYFKTLKDLVDNNGGFNSPLPAALIGNLYNINDPDEFVLGRFTVASSRTTPIFIERINIEEPQLEPRVITNPEGDEVPPPMVTMAPCKPGRYRTSLTPMGWLD